MKIKILIFIHSFFKIYLFSALLKNSQRHSYPFLLLSSSLFLILISTVLKLHVTLIFYNLSHLNYGCDWSRQCLIDLLCAEEKSRQTPPFYVSTHRALSRKTVLTKKVANHLCETCYL